MKRLIAFFIAIGIFGTGCYFLNQWSTSTATPQSQTDITETQLPQYNTTSALNSFDDGTITCQYDSSLLKIAQVNPENADNETYYCTGFTDYNSSIYDNMSNGDCLYIITNHINVSPSTANKPEAYAKALFDYLFNCTNRTESSISGQDGQLEYSYTVGSLHYKAKLLDRKDGYNTCLIYQYSDTMKANIKEAFDFCYNNVTFLAPPDLKIKQNSNKRKAEEKAKQQTADSEITTSTPMKVYYSSTYKVGTDIPAGEYVLFPNESSAYFERSSDSSGNLDSIIANDNFTSNSIITVSDGEYLKLSYCHAISISENPAVDTSGDGMFKVGIHIPAGEYKLEADSDIGTGYFEVSNDSLQVLTSITSNNVFQGTTYITVSDGQYLKLRDCKIITQ